VQAATEANAHDEHTFISTDFSLIVANVNEIGHVLDTGASSHFKPCHEKFRTFKDITP
jgi:hypothetical protein